MTHAYGDVCVDIRGKRNCLYQYIFTSAHYIFTFAHLMLVSLKPLVRSDPIPRSAMGRMNGLNRFVVVVVVVVVDFFTSPDSSSRLMIFHTTEHSPDNSSRLMIFSYN